MVVKNIRYMDIVMLIMFAVSTFKLVPIDCKITDKICLHILFHAVNSNNRLRDFYTIFMEDTHCRATILNSQVIYVHLTQIFTFVTIGYPRRRYPDSVLVLKKTYVLIQWQILKIDYAEIIVIDFKRHLLHI